VPAPAVGPQDEQARRRDERRRDVVCLIARTVGGRYRVWWDTPAGQCEVLDLERDRTEQRCPRRPTHAVTLSSSYQEPQPAYACAEHATLLHATIGGAGLSVSTAPLRRG
jgi:hypothetical protein